MPSGEGGLDRRKVGQVKPRPKEYVSREEYSFNVRVRTPLERLVGVAGAEEIIRAHHDFQSAWEERNRNGKAT